MNVLKSLGRWFVSLITSNPSLPTTPDPAPQPPLPPVAKGGWIEAQEEADKELERRRKAGDP